MEEKAMTLARFSRQFPDLFDRFLENDLFNIASRNFSLTNTTLPSVNIKETEDGFVVEMAAPGLAKEDFKIEINNSLLTISSEKKSESDADTGEYTRREFSYQSFTRSFSLPASVDSEKINAKYESGILFVEIPKREEAKPKPIRQISIS
jgi:Molecular chaperone (small heat shock protein)